MATVPAPREKEETDTEGRGAPALFTTYGDNSPFAEAYRELRVSLFQGNGKSLRSLGVTGVGPRHGGSTTAANLALIMGETGKRVILVDADLYRPSLHRFFGLSNTVGLSSVLAGEVGLSDALQTVTPPSALRLLAGGLPVQNPAALLRPERVEAILDALGQEADLVIVDLPSVGGAAYAAQLAPVLDGLLLVLLAGTASTEAERLVRRRLKSANVVGIVLNRVSLSGSDASSYRQYAELK